MSPRLHGRSLIVLGVGAALAVAPGVASHAAPNLPGLPAKIVALTPDSVQDRAPTKTVDYSTSPGGVAGTTAWRVVNGTGNGAEHWITAGPDGSLYDFGGRYINITKDEGKTWTSVQPQNPLVNAEGAIAVAPNGDVIGATWDPYSGDHLLTFKYDAASKQWTYQEDPLHTPFYDRPEVNVIPGPITISGTTYPYISTVSSHGSPTFYSTDGLTYDNVINTGAALTEWVPTHPDPSLDWSQTQEWAPLHALGHGFALDLIAYGGGANDFSPTDTSNGITKPEIFDPGDLSFHQLTLPNGKALPVNLQVDSRGWLHGVVLNQNGFTFETSADGGQTWATAPVAFPAGDTINTNTGGEVVDIRVNARLGIAAVLTRTDDGGGSAPPQQDRVYKFDISSSTPKLLRAYNVGLGDSTSDTEYHPTYETQGHRYDFASVAILPDGHVVASMLDEQTKSLFPTIGTDIVAPALAFEGDSTLPGQPAVPEAPWSAALLAAGFVAVAGVTIVRRRRQLARI